MVYELPLVEYAMCTKFGTDQSDGADFYKGQTDRQTFVFIYIDYKKITYL